MSRSGGMTTEISSTLTAAGLGQSTAVSIGGDAIIGSTYTELMPLFEADEQTEAIVIYSEPGGRMEAELARYVTENNSRLPIVAFMAGKFMDEMPGMSFGHAGTIVEGKADTAAEKIARLREAGITVAEEIARDPRPGEGAARREGGCGMSAQATPGALHRRRGRRVGRQRRRAREEADGGVPGRHLCPDETAPLEIVEENLDECVLCCLCVETRRPRAPSGHQALRAARSRGFRLRRKPRIIGRSARLARSCTSARPWSARCRRNRTEREGRAGTLSREAGDGLPLVTLRVADRPLAQT